MLILLPSVGSTNPSVLIRDVEGYDDELLELESGRILDGLGEEGEEEEKTGEEEEGEEEEEGNDDPLFLITPASDIVVVVAVVVIVVVDIAESCERNEPRSLPPL